MAVLTNEDFHKYCELPNVSFEYKTGNGKLFFEKYAIIKNY